MTATKSSTRSGTSRTYAERKDRGQPNVTLSLPAETVAKLKELAEERRASRSATVAALIEVAYQDLAHRTVARVLEAIDRETPEKKRLPKKRSGA